MEGVLRKLKMLGPKGERVLEMLKNVDKAKLNETSTESSVTVDPLAGVKNVTGTNNRNETREETLNRQKRELILKTVLSRELTNEEDEKENLAIEEGYTPDGIADHHHVLNQTTLNDRSNSEFWSSFSSSEEALLNCAGIYPNLFSYFPYYIHSIYAYRSDFKFAAESASVL